MPQLVIVVHTSDSFHESEYFLRHFVEFWREDGLGVSVWPGAGPHMEADLAILHTDSTVVPPECLACARRYPVVINGRVTDISKRRISTNLVGRRDGYPGPVIVKTHWNYGGEKEFELAAQKPGLRQYAHRLRDRLPWSFRSRLSSTSYPIFESARQVPWAVWHNPDLVVERFLPERRGDWYCLRTWVFLGDRETNSISYSKQPIIKSSNVVRRETVPEVPDELRRMRRDLGFDFGKFDYAIVDGQVVLYDANRTPTLGKLKTQYLPGIRHLAEGIRAFL